MDWSGWAIHGIVATTLLTAVLVGAQLGGLTRLDIPLMLGTFFVDDPDRARFFGVITHLGAGQFFALFYSAGFSDLGQSGLTLGGLAGLAHAAVALTLLVPLLPSIHPRMASDRTGPESAAELEPPGLWALNYGWGTPLVMVAAHIVFGMYLGIMLEPA